MAMPEKTGTPDAAAEKDAPAWPHVGMTVAEAAKCLRVSARTVQDMLAQGRLPGRIVGNKWRISPKALERFLDDYEYEEATNKQKGGKDND